MMGRRTIRLLGLAVAMAFFGTADAQDQTNDELTRQLFEQYVARRAKINTDSILAATHLVAERGRVSGFWRNILAELQRNDEQSEIGCVRVLGKMLATDALARDALRRHDRARGHVERGPRGREPGTCPGAAVGARGARACAPTPRNRLARIRRRGAAAAGSPANPSLGSATERLPRSVAHDHHSNLAERLV